MNDIPEVIEQLYYNWVTVPKPEEWPDYIYGNALLAQGLYSFYGGLRLGMDISDARHAQEPLPVRELQL